MSAPTFRIAGKGDEGKSVWRCLLTSGGRLHLSAGKFQGAYSGYTQVEREDGSWSSDSSPWFLSPQDAIRYVSESQPSSRVLYRHWKESLDELRERYPAHSPDVTSDDDSHELTESSDELMGYTVGQKLFGLRETGGSRSPLALGEYSHRIGDIVCLNTPEGPETFDQYWVSEDPKELVDQLLDTTGLNLRWAEDNSESEVAEYARRRKEAEAIRDSLLHAPADDDSHELTEAVIKPDLIPTMRALFEKHGFIEKPDDHLKDATLWLSPPGTPHVEFGLFSERLCYHRHSCTPKQAQVFLEQLWPSLCSLGFRQHSLNVKMRDVLLLIPLLGRVRQAVADFEFFGRPALASEYGRNGTTTCPSIEFSPGEGEWSGSTWNKTLAFSLELPEPYTVRIRVSVHNTRAVPTSDFSARKIAQWYLTVPQEKLEAYSIEYNVKGMLDDLKAFYSDTAHTESDDADHELTESVAPTSVRFPVGTVVYTINCNADGDYEVLQGVVLKVNDANDTLSIRPEYSPRSIFLWYGASSSPSPGGAIQQALNVEQESLAYNLKEASRSPEKAETWQSSIEWREGNVRKLKALIPDSPDVVSDDDSHELTEATLSPQERYEGRPEELQDVSYEDFIDPDSLAIVAFGDLDYPGSDFSKAAAALACGASLTYPKPRDIRAATLLHEAAYRGAIVCLTVIERRPDFDKKWDRLDNKRQTPLLLSLYGSYGDPNGATQFLLARGANVNAVDAYDQTPLMMVSNLAGDQKKEVIPMLLKAGADPYLEDDDGASVAYRLAADSGISEDDIILLIKSGVNPFRKGSNDWSVAMMVQAQYDQEPELYAKALDFIRSLRSADTVHDDDDHELTESR